MNDHRNASVEIDRAAMSDLVDLLRENGYRVIGPTVREGAIVLADLESADQLPWGWGVEVGPGTYRLRRRDDGAAFGHSTGPQSWKQYLLPSREKLWEADRADGFVPVEPVRERPRYAFLGVRPCDLRSIQILDRVLTGGRHTDENYASRRYDLFTVVVECTEPGDVCFCASMGTGPHAGPGFDLAMVELTGANRHVFVATAGSDRGAEVLASLPQRPAGASLEAAARSAVDDAANRMGRAMPDTDLHRLLADNRDSARWDDVAERCLSCANCTLVCPTCFCTSTEEVTDLSGDHTERWQRWDSCFDLQYSYIHGGSVRASPRSRYRQWISHKLSTWYDQFDSSGCVGCGRCIAWCPVGIDITAEATALHADEEAPS